MSKKSAKLILVIVALLGVMLGMVPNDAHAAKPKPQIIPPDTIYRGKSYPEWAAAWWKSAFSIPVVEGKHPIIDGGKFQGENGVVFLATVVGQPAKLDITIHEGKALFVPIINAECSVIEPPPYHGDDEASLRACANGHIDKTSGLWAKIDGLKVKSPADYRVESPLFKFGPLPEDNLLEFFGVDAPAGATSDSVDAGVYLLIAPLSPGNHKLRIRATFDEFGASIQTTFKITVLPKH